MMRADGAMCDFSDSGQCVARTPAACICALRGYQLATRCEHVFKLGEPCDRGYGGWASCGCAIAVSHEELASPPVRPNSGGH
jgi:hypothetical protein